MTQEEKQILLNDLCARLPYGVMCNRYVNVYELVDIDIKRGLVYLLREEQYVPYSIISGDVIKPYLRPMETMTEEEKSEIRRYFIECEKALKETDWDKRFIAGLCQDAVNFDYLNSRHFDYRGLIEMGLALPAPENMYNLEKK